MRFSESYVGKWGEVFTVCTMAFAGIATASVGDYTAALAVIVVLIWVESDQLSGRLIRVKDKDLAKKRAFIGVQRRQVYNLQRDIEIQKREIVELRSRP